MDQAQWDFFTNLNARPTIVCLSGSTRFWETFAAKGLEESLAGNIVLSIGIVAPDAIAMANESDFKDAKKLLDSVYLRKIELADELLVLNVGGYIGESTCREIQHAEKLGKLIRWLEPIS